MAVDPLTLEITLEQPTPIFPLLLAGPVAMPVNVASIKKLGADFGTTGKVVSNGPFRIGAADAEDGYALLKNARYRGADAIAADSVVYRPFAEAADCVAAFRTGGVEVCTDVPVERLAALKAEFGPALEIAPYIGTYFYVFDMVKKPFDDIRIRRALALAVDRDALARDAWSGGMVAASDLVPAGLLPEKAEATPPLAERRNEARRLLGEAGFDPTKPGGVVLKAEIRVGTGAAHEKTAELVAEQWKAIGVDAAVVTESNADHFARLRDGGDFAVGRAGWILDEADAGDILALLRSDNARFNYARYTNAAFDRLLDQADVEADEAKRLALLAEADALIAADVPVVPLLGYASLSLVSPKLKGWQPNRVGRHPSRVLTLAP
ncbi:MAG: peptide ABC transporter substrate-binding protein [Rhizobiales bacterium]|nr:peptide ABC transporter substrate-binding protein [Hyphomicrobiales bacterium]